MPPSAGKGCKKRWFFRGKKTRLMPPSAGSGCQKRVKKRCFGVKKRCFGGKGFGINIKVLKGIWFIGGILKRDKKEVFWTKKRGLD